MAEPLAPSALVPLAVATRGTLTECLHLGAVAVADARGTLHASAGAADLVTYLRSAAKPFQALVVVESGAADAFGLGPRELAVIAGSPLCEPEHVAIVQDILGRLGLGEQALRCGAQPPLAGAAARALAAAGEAPRPVHHDCSGKHAGMLAVCVHGGWPTERYLDAAHPLQHLNRGAIADLAGLRPDAVGVGVDGCGVPTFAISLRAMARVYALLATPSGLPPARAAALARVRDAMRAHPFLVGGTRRLDTEIPLAAGEPLVVKGGADGVHCAGLVGAELGIALKVIDGSPRAVGPAFLAALRQLDWLDAAALEALAYHARTPIRNSRDEPVGEVQGVVTLRGVERR
jgi:L-asparaginase II